MYHIDIPEISEILNKGFSKLNEIDISESNEIRLKFTVNHWNTLLQIQNEIPKIYEGINKSEKEIAKMVEMMKTHENVKKYLWSLLEKCINFHSLMPYIT